MAKQLQSVKKSQPEKRNLGNYQSQQGSKAGGVLTSQTVANPQRASPAGISDLQRHYGNRVVLGVIGASPAPDPKGWKATGGRPVQREMEDEGATGQTPIEGVPVEEEYKLATLEEGEANEWGEFNGLLDSDLVPHAFVDGGKIASAAAHWAGGTGAKGNQSVGSIDLVAPEYESEDKVDGGAEHATAWAWIRPNTGKATVTRSYTGALIGANNSYYVTAKAAARIDRHEVLHVNSTKSIHDTNISPLETRIAQATGRDKALKQGNTPAEAISALKTLIDWNTATTSFRTADTTANTPGGTIDTTDKGTADFYADYGARKVGDVNFDHYIDTPPGP